MQKKLKRILSILSLSLTGLGIVFFGLVYNVIFAGIPYQDASPELAAQYNYHLAIATNILVVGFIIFILGLIAMPFIWWFVRER